MSDAVTRFVRAAVGPDPGGPSDGELLRRFAATRDAGAFELLVWRHAGMVRAVAQAVVRDAHLAEDVAQATFLALARKAAGVRENPAGWLYRVARRVAHRQRRAAGISRPTQPPASEMSATREESAGLHRPLASDEAALLHQELAALPDRYRLPLLLCFVEGLSHAAAADRLGWPVGTVAGRIARAKDVLRPRLVRRGLAPSLAVLAVAGADGPFAVATCRAAVAFAAGEPTGVSPAVLSLTHGAIRAMTVAKLKLVAGLVAAAGALTAGGVWATQRPPAPAQPAAAAGQPPKPERAKVAADAPNPGKPEDPTRVADAAARNHDLNTLKQLGLAFHNYLSANGHFPRNVVGKDGKPLLSWRVELLPFIEQAQLYKQFKRDEPWDSPANKPLAAKMPPTYRLWFQPKDAATTYLQAFAGPGTAFDPAVPKMGLPAVSDGTSQTLMFAPVGPAVDWTRPADATYDPAKPLPAFVWPYANTIPAANLDGSAFHLKPTLTERQLRQYVEIADGQLWQPGEFAGLRQEFPPTAAEKAESRKLLGESADALDELGKLMREYLALIDAGKATPPGPDEVGRMRQQLKRLLDGAKEELARRKAEGKK